MSQEPVLTIAQHKLVREVMHILEPLAKWVKKSFARFGILDLDDLQSIGKLALYRAVVRFHEELGDWEPYAKLRAKGDMINAAKAESRAARVHQAALAAVAQHVAHRADNVNILHDTLAQMQILLDKICSATLLVQFAAGVEQAAREEANHDSDIEEYAAAITLLREAKATLPPDLQHLVRRVFQERTRYEDIGIELDVDRKTVARRLNRALDRLREYLAAHGVTHAPAHAHVDVGVDAADPLAHVPESSREGRSP